MFTLALVHEAGDGVGQPRLVQGAAVQVPAGPRPVERQHVVVRDHQRLLVVRLWLVSGSPLRRRSCALRRRSGSRRRVRFNVDIHAPGARSLFAPQADRSVPVLRLLHAVHRHEPGARREFDQRRPRADPRNPRSRGETSAAPPLDLRPFAATCRARRCLHQPVMMLMVLGRPGPAERTEDGVQVNEGPAAQQKEDARHRPFRVSRPVG